MIEVKNLGVSFGKNEIFKEFNHNFKPGTITAIMGESGKGKTTLIRCIAGLNKPTTGKVLYHNGNEIEEIINPHKDIFMMHQHYTNFPWKKCLDNVLMPITIKREITLKDKKEACNLLELVGLENHMNKYPSELSGGMNQRLSFARLLMAKPKVVLMDEPMSALDKETRQDMQNILLDLNKKTNNTIIMITHDLNEAERLATEIIDFSRRRAESVVQFLKTQGIDPSRFVVIGNGDTKPVSDTDDTLNRRTDIYFKVVGR